MRRQDEVLVAVVLLQVVVQAGRVGVADPLVVGELVRVVRRARVLASPAVAVILQRVPETVPWRGGASQVILQRVPEPVPWRGGSVTGQEVTHGTLARGGASQVRSGGKGRHPGERDDERIS